MRHIRQLYDSSLGTWVFAFDIHIDTDTNTGEELDRQRNELKTDNNSPASMVATEGQELENSWSFQLPVGMKTTSSFTHVHQIKGLDNKAGTADISQPVITFTCRSTSSRQEFQVIHVSPSSEGSTLTYLAKVPLSDFLGEWVTVSERMTCSSSGTYSVSISRNRDGKQLVNIQNVPLCLWRSGTPGLRPKWGIYRWIGEGRSAASQLRDETLLFADFSVKSY
ncbi:MAG: hypothetical protein J6X82_03770 [Bacteroidales bacterium]|nr:hypothetical protein [Bacteroidales bacterium]